MVKKLQKMSADKETGSHMSSAVKDSAQQIWLAGLGAFSKAQEEGGKVFDTLVKEGLSIQRKTQAVAEEKFSDATSKMSNMASDLQSKAGNRWDKLENIFEERVAKALGKLGVPSAKEVHDLAGRVDELDKRFQKMDRTGATARSTVKPAAKLASKSTGKPAAKSTTKTQPTARPAVKRAAKKTASPAADTSAGPAHGTAK